MIIVNRGSIDFGIRFLWTIPQIKWLLKRINRIMAGACATPGPPSYHQLVSVALLAPGLQELDNF